MGKAFLVSRVAPSDSVRRRLSDSKFARHSLKKPASWQNFSVGIIIGPWHGYSLGRLLIKKQLNKVELANKFSKAVSFAKNQEFQVGAKEKQKMATAGKVPIQNAIVPKIYLYLSQRLSSTVDPDDRHNMFEAITGDSIIAWAHVNMQREYDFTRAAANDDTFDMQRIFFATKLA